ncbi:MAG: dephospho-CoA kinase [Bacteroidales bacterium]|nr:dephospho-CoA kinase [Bacteroidales bacterium]
MKTVLVTGGIASGKSEVCSHLKALGYPVYDCDSRAKALYASYPDLKRKVEEAAGLPFERLKEIFSDAPKVAAVEAVVHPAVSQDFISWRNSLPANCTLAFMESAIAAEKPLLRPLYDSILLVSAPLKTRLSRRAGIEDRAALQHPEDIKADYIIENDSDLGTLRAKTEEFLKTIL